MPVRFTSSECVGSLPGELVTAAMDVVPAGVVCRSSVLSCIVESGGDATLPEAITTSEFNLWLSSAVMGKADTEKLDLCTVCSVLKVADAIDDANISAWIKHAAHRISSYATAVADACHLFASVQGRSVSNVVADSLLQLTPDLQHQVFAAVHVASRQGPQNTPVIEAVLEILPKEMHTAFVAAAIVGQHLEITELTRMENPFPFIQAFASLATNPPLPTSISVSEKACVRPGFDDHLVAMEFAAALQQHSSITKLHLGSPCIKADLLKHAANYLLSLTSLQELSMECSSGEAQYQLSSTTMHLLADLPLTMPCLSAMNLSVVLDQGMTRKRPLCSTDDSLEPAPTPCYLSSFLSAATSLTFLHLTLFPSSNQPAQPRPVKLPHLVHLSLTAVRSEWPAMFLSSLEAPLTRLTFGDVGRFPQAQRLHRYMDQNTVQALSRCIVGLTQLKALDFFIARGPLWRWVVLNTLLGSLTAASRQGDPLTLPELHTLRIQVDLEFLDFYCPFLFNVLQGPRKLKLMLGVKYTPVVAKGTCLYTGYPSPHTWQRLFSRLQSLGSTVQPEDFELHVEITPACSHADVGPRFSDLSSIPCLGGLQLSGYSFLTDASSFAALASMKHLRRLVLDGFTMPDDGASQLLPCLRTLSRLVLLEIAEAGMPAAFVGSVLTDLLQDQEALPDLVQLGWRIPVSSMTRAELRALVHAACARPAMRRLVLDTAADDDPGPLPVKVLTPGFLLGAGAVAPPQVAAFVSAVAAVAAFAAAAAPPAPAAVAAAAPTPPTAGTETGAAAHAPDASMTSTASLEGAGAAASAGGEGGPVSSEEPGDISGAAAACAPSQEMETYSPDEHDVMISDLQRITVGTKVTIRRASKVRLFC